jgi:4'-phosphopantetheinyl transferase
MIDARLTGPRLTLAPTEAHLWYARPEEFSDPQTLATLQELLTPEEDARRQRFHFERDRQSFLVTRALVRTVLSRYAEAEPRAWQFIPNRYGRPEIAAPDGVPPLRFNVSHTKGLVVCLVALDREIGVDVEPVDRAAPELSLAERYFAPAEVAALRRLSAREFSQAFLDFWTLKEAYIKARGMGLALPLSDFAFHLGAEGAIHISFTPNIPDDPASWQFTRFVLEGRHKVAAALRRSGNEEVALTLKPW